MLKRLRRTSGIVGWGVISTLIVLLSATCVTSGEMTAAQMACCATMEHDCGAAAKDPSCCTSEAPRSDAGSVVQRVSLPVPHVAVIHIISIDLAAPAPARTDAARIGETDPIPPGPPTYLLISTFRI